jgi:hypothetical protein
MLLFQQTTKISFTRSDAVVTALSLVLVVGFGSTALVGLFGWRERIRDGARLSAHQF